jgi:hypothetical protein
MEEVASAEEGVELDAGRAQLVLVTVPIATAVERPTPAVTSGREVRSRSFALHSLSFDAFFPLKYLPSLEYICLASHSYLLLLK